MKPLHGLLSEVLRVRAPLLHFGALPRAVFNSSPVSLCAFCMVRRFSFNCLSTSDADSSRLRSSTNCAISAATLAQSCSSNAVNSSRRVSASRRLVSSSRCFWIIAISLSNLAELRFQLTALGLQCSDLGAIAPAQYIAAAIIETVTVILFMSATRVFDLARAGDGAGLATELLLRGATRDVKSMG